MLLYPGQTGLLLPTRNISVNRPRGNSRLYDSLVAFWALDEASGNRADSIGANTLTDTNTVTSNTGLVYSTAAEFTPANSEYLTIADNAALSTGNVDFWVAAWVYSADTTTNRTIMAKSQTTTNREFRLWLLYGKPSFIVFNNNTSTGEAVLTETVSLNTWHFIIGWHDAANDQVGIQMDNGTPVTASYSGGAANSTASFRIGMLASVTSFYWTGRIGPVMMGKNYLPTAADIDYLYNGGSGRTLAAMAAY